MRIIRLDVNGWQARFDNGFDDDSVIRIADALGLLWADSHPGATILVGRDARYRADYYMELAGSVLASYGLKVKISDGPCPTPALAWCAAHDESCIGTVMLTASESSCEYGGILVRGADGGAVSSQFLASVNRIMPNEPTKDRGPVQRADFVTPYIEGILADLDVDAIRAAGFKVVADPMYGAAMGAVRPLLEALGCEASYLHAVPAPDFVGIHPVPTEPWVDKCERQVIEKAAHCGIVLDGDADRATLIDEHGRLVTRHNMVPLLVRYLYEDRGMDGRVVATTATTMRVRRQAERFNREVTIVPVGFERIYEEVREGDVMLATEEYGGVCIPSHLNERDGLYACLLVMELMAKKGVSLSSLVDSLQEAIGPMEYLQRDMRLDGAALQRLRNMLPGVNPSSVAGRVPRAVSHVDGTRLEFDDGAWVLLRVSRAKPVARAYAEAPTYEESEALLNDAVRFARERSQEAI